MSVIGPIALEDETDSSILASRIDTEVIKIINHCEQIANRIVVENRVVMDFIVEKLVEVETLDGEDFRDLVNKYSVLPNKKSS
jgi:cell division protease FtsH